MQLRDKDRDLRTLAQHIVRGLQVDVQAADIRIRPEGELSKEEILCLLGESPPGDDFEWEPAQLDYARGLALNLRLFFSQCQVGGPKNAKD